MMPAGSRRLSRKLLSILAITTMVGLFMVNIMGFVDTATGSTFGCGHDWPLCNGQLIPSTWGLSTIIEFGHRSIVGIVTTLLLILAVWAWLTYRQWVEVKILIVVCVTFVFAQAVLGAMAVFFVNPPAVMALHFGFSLLAFGALVLLTAVIRQIERARANDANATAIRDPVAPTKLRRLAWGSLIYVYCAIYYGAYVTSTGQGPAFSGWPFPAEFVRGWRTIALDVGHRTLALGLVTLLIMLAVQSYRVRAARPDLWRGSLVTLVLVTLQAITGAAVVWTHVSLGSFLAHVTSMTLLFTSICYVALQASPEPATRGLRRSRLGPKRFMHALIHRRVQARDAHTR